MHFFNFSLRNRKDISLLKQKKKDDYLTYCYRKYIIDMIIQRPFLMPFLFSWSLCRLTCIYPYLFSVSIVFFISGIGLAFYSDSRFSYIKKQLKNIVMISFCIAIFLSGRFSYNRAAAFSIIDDDIQTPYAINRMKHFFLSNQPPEYKKPVFIHNEHVQILQMQVFENSIRYTVKLENGLKSVFYGKEEFGQIGDMLNISAQIKIPEKKRNPGGFDEAAYLSGQGIFVLLDVTHIEKSQKQKPDLFLFLLKKGHDAREQLAIVWEKNMEQDEGALLTGMLFGDTSRLSREAKDNFKLSNLSHLTSVSGANVAFFLAPVSLVFYKFTGKRILRKSLIFTFLLLFGFLTGWQPSVSRAIIMAMTGIVSALISKRTDSLHGLFFSGFLMLILTPHVASDQGFLLSFSASFGLLTLTEPLKRKIFNICPDNEKNNLLSTGISSAICANITMLPFLGQMQMKQSVFLFGLNILAVFLSECITLLWMPSMLISIPFFFANVQGPVMRWIYNPVSGLMYILLRLAEQGKQLAKSGFAVSRIPVHLLIGLTLLIILFFFHKGYLQKKMLRMLLIVNCIFIFILGVQWILKPDVTFIFLDVGQGDSILIISKTGKSILLDGGNKNKGKNIIEPALDYYGIYEPDITVLSHLDADHTTGILELIHNGRVQNVFTSCIEHSSNEENLFRTLADSGEIQLHRLQKNDKIHLDRNLTVSVLWPLEITENGGNEDSLILLAETGDTGVLFMGDAGIKSEAKLLYSSEVKSILQEKADVLKVGHHGSRFSTSDYLLDILDLDAAIFCVGKNNYGHPDENVLKRMESSFIPVYRTDLHGAVVLEVWKEKTKIYKYLDK